MRICQSEEDLRTTVKAKKLGYAETQDCANQLTKHGKYDRNQLSLRFLLFFWTILLQTI